jgi:hypothetical protein
LENVVQIAGRRGIPFFLQAGLTLGVATENIFETNANMIPTLNIAVSSAVDRTFRKFATMPQFEDLGGDFIHSGDVRSEISIAANTTALPYVDNAGRDIIAPLSATQNYVEVSVALFLFTPRWNDFLETDGGVEIENSLDGSVPNEILSRKEAFDRFFRDGMHDALKSLNDPQFWFDPTNIQDPPLMHVEKVTTKVFTQVTDAFAAVTPQFSGVFEQGVAVPSLVVPSSSMVPSAFGPYDANKPASNYAAYIHLGIEFDMTLPSHIASDLPVQTLIDSSGRSITARNSILNDVLIVSRNLTPVTNTTV